MVIINADVMAVRPLQVGPIRPIAFGANFQSIYFIIHVARWLRVSDLLSIVRALRQEIHCRHTSNSFIRMCVLAVCPSISLDKRMAKWRSEESTGLVAIYVPIVYIVYNTSCSLLERVDCSAQKFCTSKNDRLYNTCHL